MSAYSERAYVRLKGAKEAIEHHVAELNEALGSPADGWNRPALHDDERAILDIGCGVGQTFAAWFRKDGYDVEERYCVGVDIDSYALMLAKLYAPWPMYLMSCDTLGDATFDVVTSRVSLVYFPMPDALLMVHRLLKPGGRFWLTMHTRRHAVHCMQDSQYSLHRRLGVHVNSWLLKHWGRTVAWRGRHETYQDPDAFCALCTKHGLHARWAMNSDAQGNDVLLITGRKL